MTAAWDGRSDFYEDDEPIEAVHSVVRRAPDAVSGRRPSVRDVGAALLVRLPVTPVDGWKLQKLCYLVQARCLAHTGLPAFHEPIEAWTHGPVVDSLYQTHRGQSAITAVPGNADLVAQDDVLVGVINTVIDEFGEWTGKQLRELTHSQQPWLEARRGLRPNERSRRHLKPATMREYFRLIDALPDDDAEDDSFPW